MCASFIYPGAPIRVLLPRMKRFGVLLTVLVTAVAGLVLGASTAAAVDPDAEMVVQQVTHEGETVTMRMVREPLRGPEFEVLVQGDDGEYDAFEPTIVDRAFIGTVDERPGAVASGIVTSEGDFAVPSTSTAAAPGSLSTTR